MQNITAADIVISIVISWGIGLAIPLVLRFLVFKQPVKKQTTWIVVVITFFVNQMIFYSILKSANPNLLPLFLMAFVTYKILNKGYKPPATPAEKS